ncbi:MAG: putative lipoprotein [Marinoscillum sp.]|jgi:predicted lipoprotein
MQPSDMNRNSKYRILIFLPLTLLLWLTSCDEDGSTNELDFDRKFMLTSLADGLIIPNFESLQTSVDNLSDATDDFIANPNEQELLLLREAWVLAVLDYQHCSAFGFGPANLPLGPFSTVLAVFPVDESQIALNIENPDFNLIASFDRDVRGFYTVEYLIYGKEQTAEEIVLGFDQHRKDYLALIVLELKSIVDQIVTEWKGSYRSEFIDNEGTSAGSSISLLFNAFVKDYENIKNFKVELPAGLTAGQSNADPTLVEAYYSGISAELLQVHFTNIINIWSGKTREGQDLVSFEEYLSVVVGGDELVTQTRAAILDIERAISSLPAGELSANIEDDAVKNLRDVLQANTANFKSSMSSLLGISITYSSGDGD